uniref:Protein kinase domain-containing protein n=1 Tax=Panagrolaimus sp. ES5 TaxID=591445 RepID=A0AC34FXT8_9BILA
MDEPIKTLSRSDAEIINAGINIAKWGALKNKYPAESRAMKNKPKIGSTIRNFKVIAEAGSGGCIVFIVERDGKLYTIKYTNDDKCNLEKEFEISEQCWKQERLLKCLEYIRCDNYSYLTMEMTGQNLHDALLADGIELKEICRLNTEALKGLEQLHQLHLVHQDVKPKNFAMSLRRPGGVDVIDYGTVAAIVNGQCVNGCMGTTQFAARDAMSNKKYDQHYRSDIVFAAKDGTLDWGNGSIEAVLKAKNDAWKNVNRRKFLTGLPEEFYIIMDYVSKIAKGRKPPYATIYGLLQKVVDSADPALIPAEELYYYPAIPKDEDEYKYYRTLQKEIGIEKSGIYFNKKSKTQWYKNGRCVVFEGTPKGWRTFRIFVDEKMFKDAVPGETPPIVCIKNE